MATDIILRSVKASALTHAEMDQNWESSAMTVDTKTADYTVLITDQNKLFEMNGLAITLTLPTVSSAGGTDTDSFKVHVTNINVTTLTTTGNGSETIDTATNFTLNQFESCTFSLNSGATSWSVIDFSEYDRKGADRASEATTNIGAATGQYIDITGTNTITGLGIIRAGIRRTVQFNEILVLTHNATSLILPGNEDITTAAGDTADFISLGSGNWICPRYTWGDVELSTYERKGANIASETTTDIGAATGQFIDITGINTITGLGTVKAGVTRTTRTTGVLTFTYNAISLILIGKADLTTESNDTQEWVSLGFGNWLMLNYNSAAINPAGLISTETSAASGQVIDFFGIPSYATRISIMGDLISPDAVGSRLQILIGDTGGFETTGYTSQARSDSTFASSTSAFLLNPDLSSTDDIITTNVTITRMNSSNKWQLQATTSVKISQQRVAHCIGVKTLTSALTQIRVNWDPAVNFDGSGTLSIIVE